MSRSSSQKKPASKVVASGGIQLSKKLPLRIMFLLIAVVAFARFASSSCEVQEKVEISERTRQVLDGQGKAVAGALIKVSSATVSFSTTSDANGLFTIPRLKDQTYMVEVRAKAFISYWYHFRPSKKSGKTKILQLHSLSECHDVRILTKEE